MRKEPKVYIFPDSTGTAVLDTKIIKRLAEQIRQDEEKDYLLSSYYDDKRNIHYEHINKDDIESYNYIIDLKNGTPDSFYRMHKSNPCEIEEPYVIPAENISWLNSSDTYGNCFLDSKYANKEVDSSYFKKLEIETDK